MNPDTIKLFDFVQSDNPAWKDLGVGVVFLDGKGFPRTVFVEFERGDMMEFHWSFLSIVDRDGNLL